MMSSQVSAHAADKLMKAASKDGKEQHVSADKLMRALHGGTLLEVLQDYYAAGETINE